MDVDWNFIALCIMLVLCTGMVVGYFAYEMHICSQISQKLTNIEKLIDERSDSNEMDK